MIKSDITIIGAGPTGLFTVFEAGLLNLRCHLIDSLPMPGGQCAEIYPKKPIYDIPSHPEILAGDLVKNLMDQISPFKPGFTLGECAQSIKKTKENKFLITTDKGTEHLSSVIIIASGLGTFEPRKPKLSNLEKYEDNGVDYIIRDPEKYRGKKILIAGGGDSALDWTIFLSNVAKEVILIHRRKEFRASPDSVQKVKNLKEKGKVSTMIPAQVDAINKKDLELLLDVSFDGNIKKVNVDYFIPLFGLLPRLGPIANWGFKMEKNAILVNNALDYQTNIPGIYAIGDSNTYPGKLKLILSGFHEATLACYSAHKFINPNKKTTLKYTTVSGITGFDGSLKEAAKSTINKID
tara:strand:- start:18 stop:1070 length:1053 start_codon:yes stop_codon:yes gene_type:complete